ncbi:hypothetical protein ACTJJ0_29000 [Chitinophaga sp. 22321]|uniref:Class I SAM-dependent methyltransferase n=1 Tax=Chitinophaga hostae TaxID=2831022 RepID=A0ABS5J9D0_9BACT|nr:class I SAM-dependent methyltransferase [Chitinophaga hostae]MBS0031032.1 class I SAM-dependent methyltransferase [Chitinophaga hostae]
MIWQGSLTGTMTAVFMNDDNHEGGNAVQAIAEIAAYIGSLEEDTALYEEKNFDKRAEAIDFIEFQVIDQVDELCAGTMPPDQLVQLKQRGVTIKSMLEAIDRGLFQRLRAAIRTTGHTGAAFKNLVATYVDLRANRNEYPEDVGYDNLDIFINGLSPFQTIPEPTRDLDPEMVHYQKTPARIIFELIEKCPVRKDDVFFDVGAGLGQAAILVNLLAGITVKGIEFEPAFCAYARACAADLNLPGVTFINADARQADYSDGTIFFMFTPFKGEIMLEVLSMLRKVSLSKQIRIVTYGPCTAQVALQCWLKMNAPEEDHPYHLAVFKSR